ncbi:MAG: nicotinate phosphoribosyltransferase [Oscillospiraceae bacterium]|nr:nicotinate phosphoribosyltransferase [Oscillospiraceae bacterium]
MMTDFYEFTMANGFFAHGMKDRIAYFDLFFRKVPDGGGFAIAAGLEQAVEYLRDLHFSPEDIACLRDKGIFSEDFLAYLADFRFTCDVWAVPEGTPVFPGEPILTVRGPAPQAQLVETMLLATVNHQSLIATKANRISRAAAGRAVMEFGARRAHSYAGALYGSRAAYIGGCPVTSNTLADRLFGIPAVGTMAHSWIQMFDSEYEAFRAYAVTYPDSCTLLLDTYDVLSSGLPNAIRVFDEELKPRGFRPAGVRIDSGDIAYLTRCIRKRLDEAGYPDCKIVVSNSLDEYIIREMLIQGAPIDTFGVGERLITSRSEPVFGGVYKLCAVEDEAGVIQPKIKISENVAKITTPHFKKIWRFYEKETGKAMADVLSVHDEVIDTGKPFKLFHPDYTWKTKIVSDFEARPLLVRIFDQGRLVYELPSLKQIRDDCAAAVDSLWDEVKRFENPHEYYVDLTQRLWDIKHEMLKENRS